MDKISIILLSVIVLAAVSGVAAVYIHMRRKYTKFAEGMYDSIDCIIQGKTLHTSMNEETLESKLGMKLQQLEDVTHTFQEENQQQKEQIQEMVSDISHQLKTPIANITMYQEMMMNHELPPEKQKECMEIIQGQVAKLDFLIQALLKMSRLENNIITLKKEACNLYDTLQNVIKSVAVACEQKEITVTLQCPEHYPLCYDAKWTAEAIFNVVDNAVKYTKQQGRIEIAVERLELYSRITISDNGIGISANHMNDIWKRFFRENKVHQEAGVGIGLYLTRTIITNQGGYTKVRSKEGEGSSFSLYLPNEYQ